MSLTPALAARTVRAVTPGLLTGYAPGVRLPPKLGYLSKTKWLTGTSARLFRPRILVSVNAGSPSVPVGPSRASVLTGPFICCPNQPLCFNYATHREIRGRYRSAQHYGACAVRAVMVTAGRRLSGWRGRPDTDRSAEPTMKQRDQCPLHASGRQVDKHDTRLDKSDGVTLRVSLPALAAGQYRVEWRAYRRTRTRSRGATSSASNLSVMESLDDWLFVSLVAARTFQFVATVIACGGMLFITWCLNLHSAAAGRRSPPIRS
jgi:hypothetical protein